MIVSLALEHARKHPRTLDRFTEDDTAALDQEQLAARTARHLVAHPAALKMIMEQSMDKASGNPAAKKAIAAREQLKRGLDEALKMK